MVACTVTAASGRYQFLLRAAWLTDSIIFSYPVHLQMFPEIPLRISSFVGCRFSFSSAYADISIPGVQKPHCSPCLARKAPCKGWSLPPVART